MPRRYIRPLSCAKPVRGREEADRPPATYACPPLPAMCARREHVHHLHRSLSRSSVRVPVISGPSIERARINLARSGPLSVVSIVTCTVLYVLSCALFSHIPCVGTCAVGKIFTVCALSTRGWYGVVCQSGAVALRHWGLPSNTASSDIDMGPPATTKKTNGCWALTS